MGTDIAKHQFSDADFKSFRDRLRQETAILSHWFRDDAFVNEGKTTGLEVEFWLVDENFLPAPKNHEFLALAAHPQIVAEIAKCNAELNSDPVPMGADALNRNHSQLEKLWAHIQKTAAAMNLRAITVGCLPTLRDTNLQLDWLSDKERYRALNERTMAMRKDRPIHLDIEGKDRLLTVHHDIMLEAAATSLQCHLQVEADQAARYFNASLVGSPLLVAVAANAPFLFGCDLWDETRIPVFEQAVRLMSFHDTEGVPVSRVGFGTGYVRESLLECFLENLEAFPILLPMTSDEKPDSLHHLRLHNGTIWRWNRPIVGVSTTGKPHLRTEQRVPSSGPTVTDMIANLAFYLGVTHWLAQEKTDFEKQLPFIKLREGFYQAAKLGLSATIPWLDGKSWNLQRLLLEVVLPRAREGLIDLGINELDADRYINGVIRARVQSGRTGAAWQRAYVSTHGKDFQGLLAKYFILQEQGIPVHEWSV